MLKNTILFFFLGLTVSGCCPAKLDTPAEDSAPPTPIVSAGFQYDSACGWDVGDKACDFMLLDQNDEPWQLSEGIGDLLLLDLSAMWCAPCQSAAATAQTTQDGYAGDGFQYVSILIADLQDSTVELADTQDWASAYGINSAPVLQGSRTMLQSPAEPFGFPVQSWPTFIWVDRDGTVLFGLRGFNEESIKQITEQYL